MQVARRSRGIVEITLLILAIVPTATAQYSGGSGTAENPYQIATAADLIALGEDPNDYDKHFILTADIDLDPNLPGRKVFDRAVIAWTRGSPGGMLGTPFTGTFDGAGHTIMHLTTADGYFLGLFGRLASGGKVENMEIADSYVSGAYSGPLVALNDRGDVLRCHSTGVVSGTGNSVGGLVGRNRGSLTDCYSTCMVSGNDGVGGLVGENDGTVAASHSSGRVNGVNHVGGLVGGNQGHITTCYATGMITGGVGSGYDVGGLVGYNGGSLTHCDSASIVTGRSSVGGLVGANGGRVTDCSSAGQVSGDGSVGGLVGYNSILSGGLTRCHSTATVTGEERVGGLVGENHGNVTRCNSSGTVNGKSEIGGLVGVNGSDYDGQGSDWDTAGPILESYSTASVSGQDQVGGLLGANTGGSLTHCYSCGSVSGSGRIGGLVGCNYSDSNTWLSSSFWDMQTSGLTTSSGGIGKTTAEMQTAITFLEAGWNFVGEEENDTNDVWWIDESNDYPRLTCELPEGASCRPLAAIFPHPRNGDTETIGSAILSWHGSDEATAYDIYLGTEESAVMDATPESLGIYRGRQPADGNTYDPGGLEIGQTHYWRIDEVNEADPDSLWKGAVWSFTTADYVVASVVDDFESYTDDRKTGQAIFQTWQDAWGYTSDPNDPNDPPSFVGNGTGAIVGHLTPPFAEQKVVRDGLQSMPMDYNNLSEPWYSEAERTWEPAQDWTVDGANALTLYFRGNPVRYAESDGVITMSGSGRGLNCFWPSYGDQVRFAYRRLEGAGSIVAKVAITGKVSSWAAQAGVMIRENLDPHSKRAHIVCSPTPRISFGSRPDPVFGPEVIVGTQAPQWVKLTREGDVFTAQCSIDGETWTDFKDPRGPANSTNIAMPGSVYIGLCVASGDWELTDLITTAVFSDIATTGDVTGEWQVASIGDDPQAGNTPEDLYVRIEDSNGTQATVVHPDAEAVLATQWQKWQIAFDEVRAAGVNVAAVKKMVIGVGDRKNPKPGGAGRIYIDDIRLTKRMSQST